jgi:hypothetical protein
VAQLIPIVVSPARFRTKRQFWSYCGLGIVMRSSSDWVRTKDGGWTRANVQQTRGLNLNHNHTLKQIFKGAATTVTTQLETDPLHQDYQRLIAAGTKPNLGLVDHCPQDRCYRSFDVEEPRRSTTRRSIASKVKDSSHVW